MQVRLPWPSIARMVMNLMALGMLGFIAVFSLGPPVAGALAHDDASVGTQIPSLLLALGLGGASIVLAIRLAGRMLFQLTHPGGGS